MKNKNISLDVETLGLLNTLNPKNANAFIREAIKEKARAELQKLMLEGYQSRAQDNEQQDDWKHADGENWPDE